MRSWGLRSIYLKGGKGNCNLLLICISRMIALELTMPNSPFTKFVCSKMGECVLPDPCSTLQPICFLSRSDIKDPGHSVCCFADNSKVGADERKVCCIFLVFILTLWRVLHASPVLCICFASTIFPL